MSEHFNFKQECESKYDKEVYEAIMDSFNTLPIAAIVDGRILAVHGGLSPELLVDGLRAIERIDRYQEVQGCEVFTDLLWSDPADGKRISKDIKFNKNLQRKCSVFYGKKAVNEFLESNDLLCMVRAHEVKMEGYKLHLWNGEEEFPPVITIFSAPNYCDIYHNKAATLIYENEDIEMRQYNYTQHPFVLPENMNLLQWSMPFLTQKVS